MSLGQTSEKRQAAYRELFRHELEPGIIDEIRHTTNSNYVLGSERFKKEITKTLGRQVTPGKSGRPRKNADTDRVSTFQVETFSQ